MQLCEREIKRYGAYFRGWCQAFGEHENTCAYGRNSQWILGKEQVGLILPKPLIKQLYRETLLHEQMPALVFSQQGVQIGTLHIQFESEHEKQVFTAIENFFGTGSDMHLFLTSHLLYGNGSKIFTISTKKPLSLIYREIGSMKIGIQ